GKGGISITLAKISAHYSLGSDAEVNLTNVQLCSETQGRYIVAVKAGQTLNIQVATRNGTLTETDDIKVVAQDLSLRHIGRCRRSG
ncbi:phosphoribosylformylglycinamidine synthase II, partial [Staphylococcus pseudintermedius]